MYKISFILVGILIFFSCKKNEKRLTQKQEENKTITQEEISKEKYSKVTSSFYRLSNDSLVACFEGGDSLSESEQLACIAKVLNDSSKVYDLRKLSGLNFGQFVEFYMFPYELIVSKVSSIQNHLKKVDSLGKQEINTIWLYSESKKSSYCEGINQMLTKYNLQVEAVGTSKQSFGEVKYHKNMLEKKWIPENIKFLFNTFSLYIHLERIPN